MNIQCKPYRYLIVIALSFVAAHSYTQTVAANYNGGGTLFNHFGAAGWWFELTDPVTVTHLGVYDHGDAGLADQHQVGIFARSSKGAALGVVTVPSGTSATLISGSRFVALTSPVMLQAGVDYYLLADNWAVDQMVAEFGGAAITYAPVVIQKGQSTEPTNNIFNPGVFNSGGGEILGPNFMIEGVPEPTTAFGIIAAVGVFALLRRRRSQSLTSATRRSRS
jgi:hypothetical protein